MPISEAGRRFALELPSEETCGAYFCEKRMTALAESDKGSGATAHGASKQREGSYG